MTPFTPLHPSHFIDESSVESIRRFAPGAETAKQLHEAQLNEIYKHQWFLLFVPKVYGGLELPLPRGIEIQEALAWADGSTAWVVTLCSGANWFSGFLSPSLARHIFSDPGACLAGSGQTGGLALKNENGYLINGSWKYASGAPHATAFTANCMINEKDDATPGTTRQTGTGAFVFWRDEVQLHKNWNMMGMQATGSESFDVKDLTVTKERHFLIDPAHAVVQQPLYRYPFLQLAEATLAANLSGMATRFLELAKELVAEKQNENGKDHLVYNQAIEQDLAALNQLRRSFYEALQQSWEACVATEAVTASIYEGVTHTSRKLALGARQLVDEAYPYCGLSAADPSTEINRVWRNLHTASQHVLLRPGVE